MEACLASVALELRGGKLGVSRRDVRQRHRGEGVPVDGLPGNVRANGREHAGWVEWNVCTEPSANFLAQAIGPTRCLLPLRAARGNF